MMPRYFLFNFGLSLSDIMNKKIVLVDGSSYLFRAFHALPQLTNKEGEPTGAIYGVVNMLKKLPQQLNTDYIAVIFDAKGKNFRHEIYPEYKANRKPMADELRQQISPVHNIVEKLGFPLIIEKGVEADDVIGTLAKRFSSEGHKIIISTGDKDMAQLINDQITLMDTMKNEITKQQDVVRRFGVRPEQIIDYLALVGDTSDNIPGVPKVGPKTAVKWLEQYQSLDGVINHATDIKGKVGENLREVLKKLPMSYELATIRCDLEIPYTFEDMKCKSEDTKFLIDAYTRYEFKGLLRIMHGKQQLNNTQANPKDDGAKYHIIFDMAKFDDLCLRLASSSCFAFDTETDSLDTFTARLVGLSFALERNEAFYIPLQHDYPKVPQQLNIKEVLDKLSAIFLNKAIKKVAQNGKFDLKILENHGVLVEGLFYDTMLESYVFNASVTKHDMDSLAKKYLDKQTTSFEDLAGKGKKQLTFNQIAINEAGIYAAQDADITLQLHQFFWQELNDQPRLKELYLQEELPVSFVIMRMEQRGVKIDVALLNKLSNDLHKDISALEEKCINLAGEPFNLSSTKQLREMFYDKMELPVLKKTPGGQASTAEEVLQELAGIYELPKLIMEHRHLSKLKSTYTDKLPLMIHSQTGRIHTSYHQAVTSTGRLSSSDPNLQNIPIRSEVGRKIRQAFVAQEGYKIVAADYSQVELRIMAHLSVDGTLVNAFKKGLDIHQATAAEILNVPANEVTSEQRRRAKAVNFGLIYGMGAFGLAKQLGISRSEAQEYIDIYFSRYPGVKHYMEKTKADALQYGYVETIYSRRLYLPDINSRNMARKKAAERIAINAPMQGTAADIIKRAMISLDQWVTSTNTEMNMIMQVHDELVFEIKENRVDEAVSVIKNHMESAASLNVPLLVDIGVGDNWDQAH